MSSFLTPTQTSQVNGLIAERLEPLVDTVVELSARVRALEQQMPPPLTGAQRRGFLDLLDTLRAQLEPDPSHGLQYPQSVVNPDSYGFREDYAGGYPK